jgi:hypothetical protein
LNGDIAKQRSEATRIAQERIEQLRSFPAVGGAGGYDELIVSGPTAVNAVVNGVNTNTTYTLTSNVVTSVDPPGKAVHVKVAWTDRAGGDQSVLLKSAIAAAAPALSGALAVRPGTATATPPRKPFGRHPTIPVLAKDFGDGRSAFVPPGRPWMALVFNNTTGLITGICEFNFGDTDLRNDTIQPADVASCDNNTLAQLASGFVRFRVETSGAELTAADVENPLGPARRMRMQLSLTSTGHPSGSFCIDDANYDSTFNGTLPFGTYFCVVKSNSSGLWSGTTRLEAQRTHLGGVDVDWFISDDTINSNQFRVCRYTSASSDTQTVPNADHPRNYVDVGGNLTNQNFVVIPSNKHCPSDGTADPSAGDLINSNTLQHQPSSS